jgi:D-alanyl-D-alanine-carboxypeptidase/D-alanyl-D-alanine-endopeptidase
MRLSRTRSQAVLAALLLACAACSAQAPSTVASPATVWQPVENAVRDAHGGWPTSPPMALFVHDATGLPVFALELAGFDRAKPLPVASASKLVSALVLLRLVDRGTLSLDATTAQVLGWDGASGAISLRQLLAQVSGLAPNEPCMNRSDTTLSACVDVIRQRAATPAHPPGAHFDYGGSHFHVAARMAEVAAGRSWNQLFEDEWRKPLALAPATRFHTAPWFGGGAEESTNPRPAGGLVASADDYMRLLGVAFRLPGSARSAQAPAVAAERWTRTDLFDELATEPHPAASVGGSPMARASGKPMRYGLGAWLECVPARRSCPVVSSAGAFGWTPWFDREAGYFALLAMYRLPERGAAATPVVADAVLLQQQLKPLIVQALAAQRAVTPAGR